MPRRSRPASTSTPRSRSPTTLDGALRAGPARRRRRRPARRRRRTSCSCPACSSCGGWSTAASSAGSCPCAASSATGCSRATGSRRSGRRGTTAPRTAAASSLDMFPHWRYVLEQIFAPVQAVTAHAVTHIPTRSTSTAQPYPATADDAAYGDLRAGRRRRRADQLLLGDPGAPRRTGRVPGRRHAGQRRRRAARCRVQHRGGTPIAGVEPRPAGHRATSASSGRTCRTTPSSTTASRCSGSCSCAHVVADAPFPWDFLLGARRRAARRARPALLRPRAADWRFRSCAA